MSPTTSLANGYIPGVTAFGGDAPQDAKSPPLDALWPGGAPRMIDPAPFRDSAWLARERAALWERNWICAGLAADARNAGDWFSFDLPGRPLVVVRGGDGRLRAFHNICRHRGAPLASGDFGHAAGRLVCGFHSWAYGLDGRCARVTNREHFRPEVLDGKLDLAPVRCAEWDGFVFICLDDSVHPLEAHLGELPALLKAYRFADMHVVKDVVVDLGANWKLMLHANLEAYHFHALHSPALAYADDLVQQIDFYPGGHSRFITRTGIPSSRLPERHTPSPEQAFLLAEVGLDAASFTGGPYDVRDAIRDAKRHPDNSFGLDYTRFSDGQLTDDWSIAVFPNMSLNAHPEGVLFMRYLPHPTDIGRSAFHVVILMPRLKPGARPPGYMGLPDDADFSPATRPSRERRPDTDPQLGWALDADCAIVPAVQRGVESAAFEALRISELEARISHFTAEYENQVGLNEPR